MDSTHISHVYFVGAHSDIFETVSKLVQGLAGVGVRILASPIDVSTAPISTTEKYALVPAEA